MEKIPSESDLHIEKINQASKLIKEAMELTKDMRDRFELSSLSNGLLGMSVDSSMVEHITNRAQELLNKVK